MAQGSNSIRRATRKADHTARQAVENPWVERLARFGYVSRGVVYLIIGLLAIQMALGLGGGG